MAAEKPTAPYPEAPYVGEAPPPYQPGPYKPPDAGFVPLQQGQVYQGYQAYPGYGYPASNTQMPNVQQPGLTIAPPISQQPPVQQTIIIGAAKFGPNPQTYNCPNCRQNIVTETYSQAGLLTWILCGTLCLLGCGAGCCLFPFCITECKDIEHKCPTCKSNIGYFRRI